MTMRKTINYLLAVLLICGVAVPGASVSAEKETEIRIENKEDFKHLAEQCALDSWSANITVSLETDLDFSGEDIAPIPTFSGIFLGNGHQISGVTLSTDGSNQALFRYVTGTGQIRNLKVNGEVAPVNGRDNIAGIAGTNWGTIEDCSFRGSIRGRNYVGGIAGENHGTISGCRFSGTIEGKRFTGGIVGYSDGMIRGSRNAGDINIAVSEEKMNLADLATASTGLALNLLSAEDENVVSDTGGVAGFSKGVILDCSNSGTVGYPHYGYNVGGIAGRQSGYLSGCQNTGNVYGKKDVAGIVGQMEPHLALIESANLADELQLLNKYMNYASTDISELAEDMRDLQEEIEAERNNQNEPVHSGGNIYHVYDSLPGRSDSSETGTISPADGSGEGGSISGSTGDDQINEAADAAKGTIEKKTDGTITGEDIDEALQKGSDAINAKINELAGKLGDVYGVFSESGSSLAQDLKLANNQFSRVMLLLANAMNGAAQKDLFKDVSEELGETVTEGNVTENTNHAAVDGDNNVGGISGSMGIEYEFDLEDSLVQLLGANGIVSNTYSSACVNSGNINYGKIQGKKDRVGGIVGNEETGTVIRCESYGSTRSSDGSYVGGVAGYSDTSIRSSYVLCTVNGTRYVGGIVGSGKDLFDNVSIIDTETRGAFVGAIAGWADMTVDESVERNYFVHESLGGVDGISYADRAAPILYEDLVTQDNVPTAFLQVKLNFFADGELVEALALDYGTDLEEYRIPAVPEKSGYSGTWSDFDLENIRFSRDIEAIYTANRRTLASEQTRDNSPQAIILLEGSFGDGVTLNLVPFAGSGPDVPESNITELWELQILNADEKNSQYIVHYLKSKNVQDGDTSIYCRKNGEWELIETENSGSYLVFPAEGNPIVFCELTPNKKGRVPLIPVVAAGGGIILLSIVFIARRKRKKPYKEAEA